MTRDDLGHPFTPTGPAGRVVSLVPSITEAIASVHAEALVGATDWCTHPSGLRVARVRGTKNPDLDAIVRLVPDVVIANQEENRELDIRRLRGRGVNVWVTRIESVPQALTSLDRLFDRALHWPRPQWLREAHALWAGPEPPLIGRVAIAVWRDPWMVVGRSTFTGDLVRRMGLANVYGEDPLRYPRVALEDLDNSGADHVILPDEPYRFTLSDGPEALTTPTQLASGRLLTWYGPSLVQAPAGLAHLTRA